MPQALHDPQLSNGLWNDSIWDVLLESLAEGKVIPVVGPDVLTLEINGATMLLEQYIARELAAKYHGKIPGIALPAEGPLNHVVGRLLPYLKSHFAIRNEINHIVKQNESALRPSRTLRLLADILPLDLFVSTTFDSLLEKAINEVRFDGNPRTDSISFSPRRGDDPRRPNDLRECKKTLTRPTVFHLMGKLSPTEDYVISDEDLLERICELQSSSRRPERLFDELKKNHLLILGEGYSDWLARVFLRMAKGRRLSATCERYEVLADSKTGGDQSLLTFLDHFSSDTRVFLSGGAAEFVEELWRRWRQRTESDPPAPREAGAHRDMPTNGIFISYASEDRGAVENIATGLARAGLPYWFDREQLGPGDKFLQAIEQYILHDCSLFLAIISKHSENRPRGVFRQEWDWALKVPGQLHPRLNFIVPVVVDDNSVPSRADPRFQHLTYASLPGGQVTPGFIEQLRGTLRH